MKATTLSKLGSIVQRLENKTGLAEEQMEYLRDAFIKILSGESADIALGLKSPGQRGKPADPWLKNYRTWFVKARIAEIMLEQEIEQPNEAVFRHVASGPLPDLHDNARQARINWQLVRDIWYS